jgi:hypothetical protein
MSDISSQFTCRRPIYAHYIRLLKVYIYHDLESFRLLFKIIHSFLFYTYYVLLFQQEGYMVLCSASRIAFVITENPDMLDAVLYTHVLVLLLFMI